MTPAPLGESVNSEELSVKVTRFRIQLARSLTGLLLGSTIFSTSIATSVADELYSKPVDQDYPKNVYWGDTHLHTRNSADAYSLGNMNLTPTDAFRFARGEKVIAHNGMPVRLRRPLDFLVISDHFCSFLVISVHLLVILGHFCSFLVSSGNFCSFLVIMGSLLIIFGHFWSFLV